jgi:hypothetical protein
MTWNSGSSLQPVFANNSEKNSSNIHIVWQNEISGNKEIYFRYSSDSGSSWGTAKRLTWNSGNSMNPAAAKDPVDNLIVVWQDDSPGNYEIYLKHSTNEGLSWPNPQRLTWNSGYSREPALAVTSIVSDYEYINTNHIVWSDNSSGNYEVYYKNSMGILSSWSAPKRLTWTSGESRHPDISTDPRDVIHVVWQDRTSGNYEIYYKSSPDLGVSWSPVKRLTWTSSASLSPVLKIDLLNNIYVIWQEGTAAGSEIYMKTSFDMGKTWSGAKRLTWSSSNSENPMVITNYKYNIHLVWCDKTTGNFEILHKRGI